MTCKNMSPLEQIARVLVAVVILGWVILTKPDMFVGSIGALIAFILIITAFKEYCPLKDMLGFGCKRIESVKGQHTKAKKTSEMKKTEKKAKAKEPKREKKKGKKSKKTTKRNTTTKKRKKKK